MTSIYIRSDTPLPERRPSDFYPTPPEFARAGLAMLRGETSRLNPAILDPGAGSGVWGEEARKIWPHAFIWGVEVREVDPHPAYDRWSTEEFSLLSIERAMNGASFNLVIGNPPYSEAEGFIKRGLWLLEEGGYLIFLLRLAFLESVKRRDGLFNEYPPKKVIVCSRRPSFTGNGKTNATAFCFILWCKGWQGKTELGWW